MYTLPVGEFKTKFSEVLEKVLKGEHIGVSFGKKRKKIAVLVPFDNFKKNANRKLGILEGKASFKVGKDFKFTDEEEFFSS